MKKRVITIGREFGSGGRTIGRQVAEKLGIEFYDRDIIKNIVKETGLKEKYVEHYGEFAPSSDHRFAYSFVDLEDEESSPLKRMWHARTKIIRKFAEETSCVIVGSCADYILRDREDCLRVFLYADEATRREDSGNVRGGSAERAKQSA